MRQKLVSIISVLIVIGLTATAVLAGDVYFDSIVFRLGSLIAEGRLGGLGTQDVTATLNAKGNAVVTCVDGHGNQTRALRTPQVSATGSQLLLAQNYVGGFSPFRIETGPVSVTPTQAGCPNPHSTTNVTFVYWTRSAITVTEVGTHNIALRQNFKCSTTQTSVSCPHVPKH